MITRLHTALVRPTWSSHPWTRVALLLATVAVAGLYIIIVLALPRHLGTGTLNADLATFYVAASVAVHHGNPYDYTGTFLPTAHALGVPTTQAHVAPPWLLIFFLPLLALPFGPAVIVWRVANLLFLAGSVALLARAVRPPLSGRESLLALVFLAAFPPTLYDILLGQVQLPMLFLLAASVLLLQRQQDRAAGITLALCTLIKLTPGLLLLYLLQARRRVALLAACITLLVMGGLWAALLGPGSLVYYVTHVLPAAAPDQIYRFGNSSITGFCNKLFSGALWSYSLLHAPALGHAVAIGASLLVLAATIALCHRSRTSVSPRHTEQERAHMSLALYVVTALLVAPLTEETYLLLLAVPATILLAAARHRPGSAAMHAWLVVGFVWATTALERVVAATHSMHLSGLINPLLLVWPFCGLVVLWIALARQVRAIH
jgi:Glycosyltransferase family 87